MDLFQQLKSLPLWFLFLLAIGFFSILYSFYSILTRLYAYFLRPPTNLTRPTDSASTSASASSSTADSVAAATVYEVFLSFRGIDTRKGITDYLYHDLVDASIQTFRDNEKLWVGEEIGPELLKAIKESKISIPIFSKNYADSKWCLLELEQIVECHKNGGQKIYPIFYDVDPSDVRNQEGGYKLAFNLHEKKFDEGTVQRWRDALKVVGKLKGLELKRETDGHEGKLVKLVVRKVLMELKKNYMHLPENLVGMNNHIEELMRHLDVDSDDVRIVGIHGMGGLGKTTMTKVIYNKMCKYFDGQCFLDNVREKSKHSNGIVELQKQFISSIQKRSDSIVSNADDGRSLIKGVVGGRKLLVVLDDVDDHSQADMLMGESNWYGPQSRIILTTRDKAVLDVLKLNCQSKDPFVVYKSYNPNLLDKIDSLKLFSKHAFKKDFPNEEYNSLSTKVVSIAAGLPLVLVVLGSTFFPLMDKGDLWKEKLRQLREIPHKDVLKQLKFSFDALEETEKEIFLDIACLFIGHDKTRPTYMWESSKLYPSLAIDVLVSKSLITIDDKDRFQMHDQLRALGREIVRKEGLHGKQSRLWCSNSDIKDLTVEDLLKSTDNFSQANIIGCGGFGLLYKAELPNGSKAAVKRLSGDCGQFDREFQAEVEALSRAQHKNLVSLQGYCRHGTDRLLIYSYMENGSLDYWLHETGEDNGSSLKWDQRLKIAQGSAHGLAYLHKEQNILHRDIKTSNILLNERFEAHLADFGLSRLLRPYDTHVTTDLVGTLGYMPPEYGQASVATFRGDVYSFGIVLLELITGRRPVDVCKGNDCRDLVSWIFQMKSEKREVEIFDSSIWDKDYEKEFMGVFGIACKCIHQDPRRRPSIDQVVSLLDEVRTESMESATN